MIESHHYNHKIEKLTGKIYIACVCIQMYINTCIYKYIYMYYTCVLYVHTQTSVCTYACVSKQNHAATDVGPYIYDWKQ